MLTKDNANFWLDQYGMVNLTFSDVRRKLGTVHAWISKRPAYCDRGHYQLNVDCEGMGLDAQDCFPRYYFDLAVALDEALRFLNWRIWKIRGEA